MQKTEFRHNLDVQQVHFSRAFLSAYNPLSKNMIQKTTFFYQKIESSKIQIISLTFTTKIVFYSYYYFIAQLL